MPRQSKIPTSLLSSKWVLLLVVITVGAYLATRQLAHGSVNWAAAFPGSPGEKVNNVVYIKVEKTASSTFSTIFSSYGYMNRLTMLLSTYRGNLVNARELNPGLSWDIAPNRNKTLQMSSFHVRYSQKFFDKNFPKETVCVTSIRDPVKWFISYVDYSPIYRKMNVNPRQVLANNSLFYMRRNWIAQMDNHVHNNFLQWLGFGMPSDYTYAEDVVLQYIQFTEHKFQLVMLAEHVFESLILLRRLLRWSMGDIFFTFINEGTEKSGIVLMDDEKTKLINPEHNRGDWLLYQHFNRTFWKKISDEKDFSKELDIFKKLNKLVVDFCNSEELRNDRSRVLRLSTVWESDIIIHDERCFAMRATGKLGGGNQAEDLKRALDKYGPFRNTIDMSKLKLDTYKDLPWPG